MAAKPCNDGTHENRILRLEDGFSELKAAHAETSTKLASLSHQVDSSTTQITDKIESCMAPVNERLHESATELNALSIKVAEHGGFIERMDKSIDQNRKSAEAMKALWRKALFYMLTAAGAVLAKELIVMLFKRS